jgi:hypothetical protein
MRSWNADYSREVAIATEISAVPSSQRIGVGIGVFRM